MSKDIKSESTNSGSAASRAIAANAKIGTMGTMGTNAENASREQRLEDALNDLMSALADFGCEWIALEIDCPQRTVDHLAHLLREDCACSDIYWSRVKESRRFTIECVTQTGFSDRDQSEKEDKEQGGEKEESGEESKQKSKKTAHLVASAKAKEQKNKKAKLAE